MCATDMSIVKFSRFGRDKRGVRRREPLMKELTLETLDFTIRIGITPTFLYFDLYLNTAYAAHCVSFTNCVQSACDV